MKLTPRQQQAQNRRALSIRRRVWAYVTAHRSASLREISYALGLSPSPDSQPNGNVAATIRFLRRAGYLDGVAGAKRARDVDVFFYVGPLRIYKHIGSPKKEHRHGHR